MLFVFLATVIFFFIVFLKLSKMKSLQDFLSDLVLIFIWKIIVSSQTIKKKPHKNNCFPRFLTITCASPRHISLGACLKHTPQENRPFRQRGCFGVSLCWPVKLSDTECSLIAGLRQPKPALLSAPAACHASESSILAQQGELEEPDPARCRCSQINEAPSGAAPWDHAAQGRGRDGTSTSTAVSKYVTMLSGLRAIKPELLKPRALI